MTIRLDTSPPFGTYHVLYNVDIPRSQLDPHLPYTRTAISRHRRKLERRVLIGRLDLLQGAVGQQGEAGSADRERQRFGRVCGRVGGDEDEGEVAVGQVHG